MSRGQNALKHTIAIQPDATFHNGERVSYSERWADLARDAGHQVRLVDVFRPDAMEAIAGSDGFMWRFHRPAAQRLFAKRLIPAVARGLRIPVFPDVTTVWYYDDKIAMHYLLRAAKIPTPCTHVLWTRDQALDYCETVSYPWVLKLAVGFGGRNVRLVRSAAEAKRWIELLFGPGLFSLHKDLGLFSLNQSVKRALRDTAGARESATRAIAQPPTSEVHRPFELQRHYLLVQEYIPQNDFDTRIVVIGGRAYAYRRFNRPGDFRASGGGQHDYDPSGIPVESIRLAFRVAGMLDVQAVALDVLRRHGEPVIVEMGYNFASWQVNPCPGHWRLSGSPESGSVEWIEGRTRAEDAIFQQFVDSLESRLNCR